MKVTIIDSQDIANPESRSVLQALVSRSLLPIEEQTKKVTEDKTESFIKNHVIGYGHDSVLENADSVIINIANISMLAAKAIEDTSLFKGTEASTRYIDFEHQPFNLPAQYKNISLSTLYAQSEQKATLAGSSSQAGLKLAIDCLEMQRKFYVDCFPLLVENFKTRFPFEENQNPTVWEKAVKAKAFDVLRAFLPCGAATTVNWTTDLRHAKARIQLLKTHQLDEVKNLAIEIESELTKKYPVSFPNNLDHLRDNDLKVQMHMAKYQDEYHYYEETPDFEYLDHWRNPNHSDNHLLVFYTEVDLDTIKSLYPSLGERPRGCPPPKMYVERFNISGVIDFGSFRDIQRHRNGICKIPVVTLDYDFENWYLEQLPFELREKAEKHLADHETLFNSLVEKEDLTNFDAQYFVPMGYKVPYLLNYDLGQMIYFTELRSSKHVHPTARRVALHCADFMGEKLPWVALHVDRSEDDFSINRGKHDIVVKG